MHLSRHTLLKSILAALGLFLAAWVIVIGSLYARDPRRTRATVTTVDISAIAEALSAPSRIVVPQWFQRSRLGVTIMTFSGSVREANADSEAAKVIQRSTFLKDDDTVSVLEVNWATMFNGRWIMSSPGPQRINALVEDIDP